MLKRHIQRFGLAAAILAAVLVPSVSLATELPNRTLSISPASVSATASHKFTFDTSTAAGIGSIAFQYCVAAAGACSTPAGLDTTAATLTAQSGATGFSMDNSVQGRPLLVNPSQSPVAGGITVSYTLGNITNPSAANTSFYVRITTYTGTDGATGATDAGTVGGVVVNGVVVNGTTPESLIFCVGTSGTDCTNITGNTVNLGVFSPLSTATGTSVMAASTNASGGYAITVSGGTLQNGAQTIPAMGGQSLNSGVADTSVVGTSQFGFNLMSNTTPASGAAETGAGAGLPFGGYGSADHFRFFSGDTVAQAAGPTKSNTYTADYVVNIAGDQAAGVYTATFTYTCTATF